MQGTAMASQKLHDYLGPPIEDASEETFLLFSQDIPSNNLGFVDSNLKVIELEIAGRDFVLQQSPGLLTSSRRNGTTGAVLWKITPLLAAWLASSPKLLSEVEILHSGTTIVELGCGVAGLLGLVLSRLVKSYVLTDQEYVMKHLRENISNNATAVSHRANRSKKGDTRRTISPDSVPKTLALDWEIDKAEYLNSVIAPQDSIDLVILCDCVYNDFLIKPLVQTCVDVCSLRGPDSRTIVLVAQQLRSDAIAELFLDTLMEQFDVWRVPEERIGPGLGSGSGYVVHLAALKHSNGSGEM
ncbi:hypothetical protein EDD36DRAFT_264115 [Exophiala viscosa]|uniref:Diaminohydroxyphosphoribosylamino-pyrimidine deaminase n=1 Tax=Exophiala viscosa TaxID=2486360 RepID=A0AAN6DVF2_9EURO|nr:hypothetical protein EDD36DRAFT_264115 [Exophiala viscosa]